MTIMPAAVITRTTAGHEGQGQSLLINRHWGHARSDARADLDGEIQDANPALDAISDPSLSLPNSQTSSLNDSSASQASQLHFSSIDTSQSSVGDFPRRHASPLLPSASQETQTYHDGIRNGSILRSQPISREHEIPPQPTLTASKPTLHANTSNHVGGTTHGQKRTSSGHIKSPSLSLSISPVDVVPKGHSRHTSTASNGSQVGEVRIHDRLQQARSNLLYYSYLHSCARVCLMLWSKYKMDGSPALLMKSRA